MRIGLTYDLRDEYLAAGYGEVETAEFDRPETINAIAASLESLGHQAERIGNVRQLIERVARGERWDLVFNIAEGFHGLAREAQVPAVLDAYRIPYTFSDPLVCALGLHKGWTKLVVRAAGVPTPDFALVERTDDVDRIDLPYPLFAKPVAEGTGKGINAASKIVDPDALRAVCSRLLNEYPGQPVLVETFLPGREFTVGITGTGSDAQVIGTMEIILKPQAEAEVYSYVNKEYCDDLVEYEFPTDGDLVKKTEATALAAWQALGCRDAGRIDMRTDAEGRPCFIEVNPLAGLNPYHSDLPMICEARGVSFTELVRRIVDSASRRIPKTS